ncbi:hypothetical protein P9112_003554 [Eukaryota sp. TZLM1-RC]
MQVCKFLTIYQNEVRQYFPSNSVFSFSGMFLTYTSNGNTFSIKRGHGIESSSPSHGSPSDSQSSDFQESSASIQKDDIEATLSDLHNRSRVTLPL